jgi:hypothetical protein
MSRRVQYKMLINIEWMFAHITTVGILGEGSTNMYPKDSEFISAY